MTTSVVLLSSGLDSTVNLYASRRDSQIVLALTFDYGQKAAVKEIESAKKITQSLGLKHKVVELPFFKDFGKSSLIEKDQQIPVGADVAIDNYEKSMRTAQSVWVPNRNGVFLNVAVGFAESLGADRIVPGFNREEAQTFPDNSQDFLQSLTNSLSFSTANKVKVHCYTTSMTKSEIVKYGTSLNVEWSMMWPCYHAFEKWCGECESCQRSRRALKSQNIDLAKAWR